MKCGDYRCNNRLGATRYGAATTKAVFCSESCLARYKARKKK